MKLLLSTRISMEEKKRILQSEYQIEVEKKTEMEMKRMCNLSEAIEERGIQKGIQKGIQQEREQGIALLIEAYKEMEKPKEMVAEKVRQKYNLTPEKMEEVMTRYW